MLELILLLFIYWSKVYLTYYSKLNVVDNAGVNVTPKMKWFCTLYNSVTRQRSRGELNSHYPMVILFEDCIHLRVKLQTVLFLAHLQGGSKPRNVMMRVWNVTGTNIMPTIETNIHWKRPMLPILARKPSTLRVIVSLLLWVSYGQEKRQKIGSMQCKVLRPYLQLT